MIVVWPDKMIVAPRKAGEKQEILRKVMIFTGSKEVTIKSARENFAKIEKLRRQTNK